MADDILQPGGKPLPKWFVPAAIGVVVIGLYYAYKSSQNSAASTTAATTSGSTGCTDANGNPIVCGSSAEMAAAASSTGTDQQALINQLQAGLSGLFGSTGSFTGAVAGNTAAITTLAQAQGAGFTSVAGAQAAQTTQLQTNLAAVQAAILAAQQSGDTATANALQSQSASLQAALTAQSGGIASGFQSLIANLGTGFQALTSGITQSQTQSAAQGQAVISQIQQTQTALSSLFAPLQNQQYYQIGRFSGAACLGPDGNISLSCAETIGEADFGHSDESTSKIQSIITAKYGSCIKNNLVDYTCVGKIIAGGQPIGGH